jgi:molybdate transport system substrate-binding protein
MAAIGRWSLCLIMAQSLVWFLSAPPSAQERKVVSEILVSAAASLKDVMGALARDFEKSNPKVKLTFNYGASGQLKMQIENGAPADLFLSAAVADMDALDDKGLIDRATRINFAGNALVLIHNRSRGPRIQTVEELLMRSVYRIAIGNPATVPAGRYAKEALESWGLYKRLENKLIFSENARQVLDYVARGEVDAGFVYKTDALTEFSVEVAATIAADRHQPILYTAAVLTAGKHPALATQFVDFLRTEEAQGIFRKYGFE